MKYQTEILYCEVGGTLAQVAQVSCGCPIPGIAPGEVGWGSGQPGLVKGVSAHVRRVVTK